jgi:hypothetical protein
MLAEGCLALLAGIFSYATAHAQSLNQLNFQAHSGYEITTGVAGQNLDLTTKASDGGGIGIGPRNSTSLFIDTAGNVGIGTTSPGARLHVNGSIAFGSGNAALAEAARRSKNASNADIETVRGLVTNQTNFLEVRGFAPPTMYRTTEDRPAPYGIGFGNGSESGGIMPIGAGDNLQEIMFYGSNSGPTTFTWKHQVWESSAQDPSNSNYYSASAMSLNANTGQLYIAGNVGIGDTAPADKLDVNGNATISGIANCSAAGSVLKTDANGRIVCSSGGGAGSGTANILPKWNAAGNALIDTISPVSEDGSGNVGIGTNSPQAGMRMDVRSGTGDGNSAITAYGYNGNGGMAVRGYGYATSGTGANYSIYGNSSGGRSSGTNIGGYFEASGAPTNYALITGNGNVGIGTSSPARTLDVSGAIRTSSGQFFSPATASFYTDGSGAQTGRFGGLLVGTSYDSNPSSNEIRTSVNQDLNLNARGTGNIYFKTADGAKVTLTNSGDVGIGTSPADKLHVSGNATVSGIANCTGTGSALKTDANGRIVCGTVAGGITGSGANGQATFWTSPSTVSGDNGFWWDNANKRLGIGRTDPASRMEVSETAAGALTFPLTVNNADNNSANPSGTGAGIKFRMSSPTDGAGKWVGIAGISESSYSNTVGLAFYTGSGAQQERMRISNGGNVGIGTTSPSYKLDVNGFTRLNNGVRIGSQSGADWIYYPNLVSYRGDGNVTGAIIIHTNIARASTEMFKMRVTGYGYGQATNIDFTVVAYAYSGATGSVDGASGAAVSYSINDNGNDGLPKWIGVDANGKLAIAIGDYGTTYYYYRLSADFWATRYQTDASSGWSVDTSTVSGFGWLDIKSLTPALTQLAGGNVGIGTMSPADKLHINGGNITVSGIANCTGTGSVLKTDANGRIVCATITGGMTGSGTGNYIPKWTGAGTLGNTASPIYEDGSNNIGIGTTSPNEKLHIVDATGKTELNSTSLGASNVIIQSSYGARTVGTGAALGFAFPANTDGSNIWEQGRILSTPDNANNGNAAGRMYLQTRYYNGSAWDWNNNMILTSNGYVGIGVVPSQALDVNGHVQLTGSSRILQIGTSGCQYLYFGGSANNIQYCSNQIQFNTTQSYGFGFLGGSVGIGTATPSAKLEISGGSANWNETTPGTARGTIHLVTGNSTDHYGNAITWEASDASGAQAGIYVRSDGSYGTKMYIATTDSYANGSKTRIMIDSNGNVGIGNTSPADKLHVSGNATVSGIANCTGNAVLKTDANGRIVCATGASWSSSGNDIYNPNSGNVGIGTSSPAAKLDVSGAFYSRLVTKGNCTGAITIDWNAGNTQHCVLTGNVTFTFANGQSGANYRLILKQDATGNRTVTWPASVRWGSGGSPSLTATASKSDYVGFFYNGVDSTYDGNAFNAGF